MANAPDLSLFHSTNLESRVKALENNHIGLVDLEIWDYETLVRTYSNAGHMYKSGDIYIAFYQPIILNLTGINTMLQFKIPGYLRNNSRTADGRIFFCIDANLYIGTMSNRHYVVQQSGVGVYLRPNILSSEIPSASSVLTGLTVFLVPIPV